MTGDELRALKDDWDSEGAPAPTEETIREAEAISKWAHGLEIEHEMDADVLGGTAVYLHRPELDRRIWISCLNVRETVVAVYSEGNEVLGTISSPTLSNIETLNRLNGFLRGEWTVLWPAPADWLNPSD